MKVRPAAVEMPVFFAFEAACAGSCAKPRRASDGALALRSCCYVCMLYMWRGGGMVCKCLGATSLPLSPSLGVAMLVFLARAPARA
jgi:hypothetical protein